MILAHSCYILYAFEKDLGTDSFRIEFDRSKGLHRRGRHDVPVSWSQDGSYDTIDEYAAREYEKVILQILDTALFIAPEHATVYARSDIQTRRESPRFKEFLEVLPLRAVGEAQRFDSLVESYEALSLRTAARLHLLSVQTHVFFVFRARSQNFKISLHPTLELYLISKKNIKNESSA